MWGDSFFLAFPLTLGVGQPDFWPNFGAVRGAGLRGIALSFVCDNRGRRNFCTSPASSEPKKDRPFYVRGRGDGGSGWAAFCSLRCLCNLVEYRWFSLER